MELNAHPISDLRSSGLTMNLNKVSYVKTIGLVAKDLGESEDWLCDVATEMEPEDGLIWVYGVGARRDGFPLPRAPGMSTGCRNENQYSDTGS